MLRSIITTALRNIVRHWSFSLINLVGLGVSMSLGLLIILVINSQYSFDKFHADADRIFRVNTRALRAAGGSEPYASVPLPLGQVLRDNYTFTESVVRLHTRFFGDVEFSQVTVPLRGLFADPEFFNVFGFDFARGQASNAFQSPNGLVLTHEAAEKIFGKAEPMGQTVLVKGIGEFVVSGVLKPYPKTHLEFEMLAPFAAVSMDSREGVRLSLEEWNNYYSGHIYIKLRPGTRTEEVEGELQKISTEKYAGADLEVRDKGYEFYLQPLTRITPGPILSNNMGRGLPELLLIMLSSLAAVIMVMACFNYTSLTIAKSLARAREIGVRKVVGAGRLQVFGQFVGEAIVFSLLALLVAYLLLQATKPAFLSLHIASEFDISLDEAWPEYLLFVGFAAASGILAGLLPAGYLSAFKPVRVLKSTSNLKVYSRLTFRKILMVTQFALSTIFLLMVLLVYNQTHYMFTADYGFDQKNTLLLRLQGQEYESIANEIRSMPGVERVGGVSHSLGTWADWSSDYKVSPSSELITIRDFRMDENYLTNLNIPFLMGGNFEGPRTSPVESEAIINERAVSVFGFSDVVSAMGQSIIVDSVQLRIIGVTSNFHFRPLNYQIGPLVIRQRPEDISIAHIRIASGRQEEVVKGLETLWKKRDTVHAIEWTTQEAEIDNAYEAGGITDVVNVIGYIAFIALMLACLGMLGMAMYSTQTRIKEIGVRKVMGAGTWQITFLLSKAFVLLVGIAMVLGLPLGLLLSDSMLSNYAFRAEISVLLIGSAVLTLAVLGAVTIGSQTLAAARRNPVNTLRYE